MRVMLFTDTLGDVNGVCRFIQNMGEEAARAGRDLRIVTSTRFETPDEPYIHNLKPIFAMKMPKYPTLDIVTPPFGRMLALARRSRPDVFHLSTPGPVGLTGLLAAKMAGAPRLGVYHTDFPAYIAHLFRDPVFTRITSDYMKFFYNSFERIFSRSEDYIEALERLGFPRERCVRLRPGVALETFGPEHRDTAIWSEHPEIRTESVKALYCGRVSVEKNLPMLVDLWKRVKAATTRRGVDAELIVIGDGPYRQTMERELSGTDAHFLGFRRGLELSRLYASSDVFVFPSLTDTLGQVVLESQASGLPVVVSDSGGPKEVVKHGETGFVLDGRRASDWSSALTELLCDAERRGRMGQAAQAFAQDHSIEASFREWWAAHEEAWRSSRAREAERDVRAEGAVAV